MGERRVLPGDIQQLAERWRCCHSAGAWPGSAGGEEQCAGCAFAEPGCEQGAAAYFRGDNLFEFLRVEEEEFGAGWLVFHHGHAQHDAVIGCHGGSVQAIALLQALAHCKCHGGA